ncbi:hypothetical protein AB0I90_31580 [Micromonospora wenchangensis]|uniref:hypothetical protein n=1 Tax=Micromonospora wenchangensis TaxID=1185415 RepID=UPI0033C34889
MLIAVRELLVKRFGEQGCLHQLAKLMRCESETTEPARTSRQIARRLSEQMGSRAVKGPDWRTIKAVLRHCVPDTQRSAETARLRGLFAAARGHQPDEASGDVIARSADSSEVIALRAALRAAEQDAAKARQDLQTLADDQAVALRAAGNLTTRATEQEQKLAEAVRQVSELTVRVELFRGKYEEALSSSVRDRAELSELRERLARLVAFVESQGVFRNARVATSALPSTAQSVGIAPTFAAPPALRAVASYLRTRAELGGHQVAAIAQQTGLSPEVVERTFAAQDLVPYPVLAQIGVAVSADSDYLVDAFMRAETEFAELRKAEVEPARGDALSLPAEVHAAFDEIIAGLNMAQRDEPTKPGDGVQPVERSGWRRRQYQGRRRRTEARGVDHRRLIRQRLDRMHMLVALLVIVVCAAAHLLG